MLLVNNKSDLGMSKALAVASFLDISPHYNMATEQVGDYQTNIHGRSKWSGRSGLARPVFAIVIFFFFSFSFFFAKEKCDITVA